MRRGDVVFRPHVACNVQYVICVWLAPLSFKPEVTACSKLESYMAVFSAIWFALVHPSSVQAN